MLALVETDPEVRLGQGAEVVADVGVLSRHVDNHVAEGQLFDVFVFVGFQHAHEAEILGRDLVEKVALQDSVRHLVAEDDESATVGAEQTFRAAFDVLDDAFVVFVKNDKDGVNSLKIRHF